MKIPFYSRFVPEDEYALLSGALQGGLVSAGTYTQRLQSLFSRRYSTPNLLLTPSCGHALELACQLLQLSAGDEVVLCDISSDTQTLSLADAAKKITCRTKAVIAVHYAGISCDLDSLDGLCQQAGISLIEDAAQAVDAFYKGRALGTIGRLGAYSFHYTKNFSCGEGGALVYTKQDRRGAEIFQNNGTNRSEYLHGICDRYAWVEKGSSPIMSELCGRPRRCVPLPRASPSAPRRQRRPRCRRRR